ncbi:lamin tail domain-containing protein [Halopenitus persicus]|uniref:Competence protein ComEC n=1 Tax=Halopenitus persicus TaxID=1048396 RepID=A0A1H3NW86_9EURY|nr:lamin tail domain-containing protein [Halopenitus persicus]SDY92953.1 competence protein ComEC [Halopenitus persicus]
MDRRFLGIVAIVLLVAFAGCGGTVSDGTPIPTDSATDGESATTESLSPQSSSDGSNGTEGTPSSSPNGTLSVHFINVGQGSSTLIVGPTDETILIDSGDWSDDGEDVIAYLERHNVDRIDHLVTTHPDADHIGGHEAIITHYETQADGIGAVYDPGITSSSQTYDRYLDAIEEHDVTLYETRAGDQISIDNVEVQVLAPPEGYIANGDRNENSIVLKLNFGRSSFLLPGDGESASERYLIDEYGSSLNTTVLSPGHHGSQSSSSAEFLDTTSPRIAVISSAYDSQYGHPHEEVLQRLEDRSIRTYWTATHGNIRMVSNGSAITVSTQQAGPIVASDLRDGEPIAPGAGDELEPRTIISATGTASALPDGGSSTPETRTPMSTTSPNADQESHLSIAEIHADAEGNDHENLNDEYIVFENTGDQALELGGWTVTDDAGNTYTFPNGYSLEANGRVTLYTGRGTDSDEQLYWGRERAVWNNGGDTVTVLNDVGDVVLEEEYE